MEDFTDPRAAGFLVIDDKKSLAAAFNRIHQENMNGNSCQSCNDDDSAQKTHKPGRDQRELEIPVIAEGTVSCIELPGGCSRIVDLCLRAGGCACISCTCTGHNSENECNQNTFPVRKAQLRAGRLFYLIYIPHRLVPP